MSFRRAILAIAVPAIAVLLAVQTAFAATPQTYVVQPGDTLWSIAVRQGTTVAALVAANGIANPDFIYSGQRLVIPGSGGSSGSATATSTPVPTTSPAATATPTPVSATPQRGAPGPGSILAGKRLVTYYGNSWSDQMGILGELSPTDLVARLRRAAQYYEEADGRPVLSGIEFIATVAQASAGSDGMYRFRMPMSEMQKYADLAAANGMILIVDVQIGRSTVEKELPPLLPLLQQKNVHLALDPEFDMWGSDKPGVQLGHMTAQEVNYAVDMLSRIVAQTGGSNKILIVHQFTASMLPDKQSIKTDPNVDLAVVMDGFGSRNVKLQHYNWYVRDDLIQFGGIKIFFKQDANMYEPEDVVTFTPPPDVVIYQ